MKKLINSKMLFILGAALWVCSSCQKDALMDNGTNTGLEDYVNASQSQQIFNGMCVNIENAFIKGDGAALRISEQNSVNAVAGSCGSVTNDLTSMPRKTIIDFGAVNCKAPNGHWYRGKLIITWTGDYKTPGTVETYVSEDLYQDNVRIDVNRTTTNLGYPGDGQSNMHFSVSDYIKLTFPNQASVTITGEIDREWAEGLSTDDDDADDVYMISGTHTFKTSGGINLESQIREKLRQENSYQFYVTGVEKVANIGTPKSSFNLDYGYPEPGVRDNLALATFRDGKTEVVEMQ